MEEEMGGGEVVQEVEDKRKQWNKKKTNAILSFIYIIYSYVLCTHTHTHTHTHMQKETI